MMKNYEQLLIRVMVMHPDVVRTSQTDPFQDDLFDDEDFV